MTVSLRATLCMGGLLLLGACGGDSTSKPKPPDLTTDTALQCPRPDGLPMRLMTYEFESGASKQLADDYQRVNDEASDTLGNEGGAVANSFLAEADAPSDEPVAYRGRKARSANDTGLLAEPFGEEWVSLWYYDKDNTEWKNLGRAKTSDDGQYNFDETDFDAPTGTPVYSILEGDGTCAEHRDFFYPAGTKFVVSDIDGTLTQSDAESFKQIGDASYVPKMMKGADVLLQTWAEKGYKVLYLTARPHVVRAATRQWLDEQGFPAGPVITMFSLDDPLNDKKRWLKRMQDSFGWKFVAAYGNAQTDVGAYSGAGISEDVTFMVGEDAETFASEYGTVTIADEDFTAHIAEYVENQPDADASGGDTDGGVPDGGEADAN